MSDSPDEAQIEAWWQAANLPSMCYTAARIGWFAGRDSALAAAEREREGMRKALEKIGAPNYSQRGTDWFNVAMHLQDIARRALNSEPNEP